MPITINGSGTVTGLSVGGVNDGAIAHADLATSTQPIFSSYAIIEHQESHGTAGGGLTGGGWRTRPLNTEVADPDGIVSLSSNQFTLQAGTYLIEWRIAAYNCDSWTSRLQNITDSSTAGVGDSLYTKAGDDDFNYGEGVARVTISGAKAFEIQQNAYTTQNSNGMGTSTSANAGNEVHGRVKIYKEAS